MGYEDAASLRSRENARAVEREHALAEHPLLPKFLAFSEAFRVLTDAMTDALSTLEKSPAAFGTALFSLTTKIVRAGHAFVAFESEMNKYMRFPMPESSRDRETHNG